MTTLRRRTRPARHALAYGALRLGVGALRCLPTAVALGLGGALGRLVGLVARRDRARMRAQLAARLPDPPPVGQCFADLGRRFVEFALARRLLGDVALDLPTPAPPGPLIVATSHLGNWELLAATLAARGYRVHAIGARRQSGPIFRWLDAERAALGVTVFAPGDGRRALATLRDGGILAVFVDQRTRERARPIPFLGADAPVPLTLERLRRASGATPLFAWLVRTPDGHRGAVEPLPEADPLGAAIARLEALVREHPRQWVWQHARWGER